MIQLSHLCKIFLCFIFLALAGKPACAAIEPYERSLTGRIRQGDTLLLQDEKFRNPSFKWSLIQNLSVDNNITFGLYRHGAPIPRKNFRAKLDLKVEYWSQPGQDEPIIDDHVILEIAYDTNALAVYQAENAYYFKNGHKVKITVNSITSEELGSEIPDIFQLVSKVTVDRNYLRDPDAPAVTSPIVFLTPSYNETEGTPTQQGFTTFGVGNVGDEGPGEFLVRWDPIGVLASYSQYDLDWTFIDGESPIGLRMASASPPTDAELTAHFRNNFTRVSVANTLQYPISLVHQAKYLMVRVRGFNYNTSGEREEGNWTTPLYEALTNTWHESNKNWQYNATYVEGGKKKEVVTYADGTMRARQSVTLANPSALLLDPTRFTVVQETLYDQFGRAAVQILPAPLRQQTQLKYYAGLHLNSSGLPYNYRNFYGADMPCNFAPEVMSAPSATPGLGAAGYYSANNTFIPDNKNFKAIPKADGFPFSVTRFTPDNTGRISEQGGVGAMFQPGQKATRYYYGKPNQWELDRIFGNDVGYANHYMKKMVVDPNGQVSLSYENASGKVIATALAGDAPTNLDGLPGKPLAVNIQQVILEPAQFTFDPARNTLTGSTNYMATTDNQPLEIRYDIQQLVEEYKSGAVQICSNCYYTLKATITDDCGNVQKVTTDVIGSNLSNCNINGVKTGTIPYTAPKIGVYYIRFELGLSEDVIGAFTDDFIRRNTDLYSRFYFILEELKRLNFKDCLADCLTCANTIGEKTAFKARIVQQLQLQGVDVVAAAAQIDTWAGGLYDALSAHCIAIQSTCNESPCEEYARVMRMDVSPGGQYALFGPDQSPIEPDLNILFRFWRVAFQPLASNHPDYIAEQFEVNGKITSPYDGNFTLDMLIKYWKPSWADRFLQFHPEYCKLKWCNDNGTYVKWDTRLQQEIITASQISKLQTGLAYSATVADWLLAADPYFKAGAPGAADYTTFRNKLLSYTQGRASNTPVKGLSQYVDYMLYCSNGGGSTNIGADGWQYCTPVTSCRVPDREWTLYKLKYLELKEEIYKTKRDGACSGKCLPGSPVSVGTRTCPDGGMFRLIDGGDNGTQRTVQVKFEGSATGFSQVSLYVQYVSGGAVVDATWNYIPSSPLSALVPSDVQVTDIRIQRTVCTNATIVPPACDGVAYTLALTANGKARNGFEFTDSTAGNKYRYVIEKGYANQRPDSAYYCVGGTSTFYNCLKVTIAGNSATHNYYNVWLIRCPATAGTMGAMQEGATQLLLPQSNTVSLMAGGATVGSCTPHVWSDFIVDVQTSYNGSGIDYFVRVSLDPNAPDIEVNKKILVNVWVNFTTGSGMVETFEFDANNQNSYQDGQMQTWWNDELTGTHIEIDCEEIVVPVDTCALLLNKKSRFDEKVVVGTGSDVNTMTNDAIAAIKAQTVQTCNDNAETWVLAMEDCLVANTTTGTYATKRAELKAAFALICQLGGDIDHPYGSSTTMPGKQTSQGYKSFGDAIKGVLGISAYTMVCNPWVVNGPAPYGIKVQATKMTVSATSPEICKKLAQLKTLHAGAGDFHTWLVNRFGAAAAGTAAQTAMLEKGCGNCKFLLEKDLELPVYLEPGTKGSVDRTTYNTAKTEFNAQISGGAITTHANYGLMLASFMNQRWGFTMGYEEYAAYEATAATQPNLLLVNQPAFGTVQDDPLSCIMSLVNDAVNQGTFLYTQYIREQRRAFRQRYIETCAATRATVQMDAPEQIYHYTLYYYNQAGQLIRTVPPAGVKLLTNAEVLQVGLARSDYKPACTYAGPVVEGVKSQVNTGLNTLITNGGALEYWLNQSGTGPVQAMHTTDGTTRYLLTTCLSGGNLTLDVYKLIPAANGSGVDIESSRHTAVDVSSAGATGPWYHVIIQGASLFADDLTVYVNGVRCPKLAADASGGCGWEIAHNGTAWVYPENYTAIRHIRTYSSQRDVNQVQNLAANACLGADTEGADAGRTGWFAFGITGGTGQYPGSTVKPPVFPAHVMPTSYAFNTLGQVVKQKSPDAGESEFWYDFIGRIVVSQNAEQKTPTDGSVARRSYTKYDPLGRIEEVGTAAVGSTTIAATKTFLAQSEVNTIIAGAKKNITKTYYDLRPASAVTLNLTLTHLRKRVAASSYNPEGTGEEQVTYYSYDLMGNVKTMWQKLKDITLPKMIEYDYDLASGKVNAVRYQGTTATDRFMYLYDYDAENRLTQVSAGTRFNSANQWKLDNAKVQAKYYYYPHGPLARTELGPEVQGVDYAYTLQGWLKGVNSQHLGTANDLGEDAATGGRSTFAKDAFGYSLGYYPGDFSPVSATFTSFNQNFVPGTADHGKPLYNGNIATMSVGLDKFATGKQVGYTYAYDQLNRIKRMRQQIPTTTSWVPRSDMQPYAEDYVYDANGNIQDLNRNGAGAALMDDLGYTYRTIGGKPTNQLATVTDVISGTTYGSDFKGTHTYTYDNIGNLRQESGPEGSAGATKTLTTTWNALGKIVSVSSVQSGVTTTTSYGYDASGNRAYKTYTANGVAKTTWYVRDAQGNALAVYSKASATADVMWDEQTLYGSSRLGLWKPNLNVTTPNASLNPWLDANNKQYELSNHLGNVMTVMNDGKAIVSQQDYYPFGSPMPGRYGLDQSGNQLADVGASGFRYGFNGQEKSDEISGEGNSYTAEFWQYDTRIGKRWNTDPRPNLSVSPYATLANNPILYSDPLGDTTTIVDKNNRILHVNMNDKGKDIVRLNSVNYFKKMQLIRRDPEKAGKIFEEMARNEGEKIGRTLFGFDFMSADNVTGEFGAPMYGMKLNNSIPGRLTAGDYDIDLSNVKNGQELVNRLNSEFVNRMSSWDPGYLMAKDLARLSGNGQVLDIKVSLGKAMYAGFNFKNDTYTSLRILGNLLFGMNLHSTRPGNFGIDWYYNRTMTKVGEYNQKQNGGNGYNAGHPFFGEHTFSGTAIRAGYYGEY